MDIKVTHNTEKHQFTVKHENSESHLNYRMQDNNTIEFTSTYVPEEYRNNGVAASLATEALNYARLNKLKVIPTCSYVRNFINEHSEYKDMVE